MFHFHTIYHNNVSNGHISMRKNGAGLGTNSHYSSDDGALWNTINITTTMDLAVNDYVDVYANSSSIFLHGNDWNEFSGYLVG